MTEVVVKVGGRLARANGLRALCIRLAALGSRHRMLVVPGGSVFADAVRDFDARMGLSSGAAHWMAVLAMDQYGYALADLVPGSTPVRSLEVARVAAAGGSVPVLLPSDLVRSVDALPHDWSVTSDTIAAWVAGECGASRLVLLKDGTGMRAPLDDGSGPPSGAVTLRELSAWPAVDGHLHRLLDGLAIELWVLDGEQPDRLEELLDGGETQGVSLRRPSP